MIRAGVRGFRASLGSITLLAMSPVAFAQDAPAEPPADQPLEQTPPAPPVAPPDPTPPTDAPQVDPKFLPPSDPWPPPQEFDANAAANALGFRFGSYGRILAGTDLRGGKPESANIVAHGPRIVEDSYLELELSYGFETPRGKRLRPVITLAFDSTLFHDTGDFDAQPAIRNLYLDAQLTKHVTAWVGSRMYRGDDIYLFDYWPLDDLNTIGAGLYARKSESKSGKGDAIEVATHVGVNRLNNSFQFQEIDVPDPEQGSTTAVQLNRQRMVLSGTASYLLAADEDEPSIKVKAHAEFHALPSGTRERMDGTLESLPSDRGYLLGAQATVFGMSRVPQFRRHLNLYMRYARGLAAFDELAPPTSFGPELKTDRASELSFGVAGNWDHRRGNVMLGVLSRRFVDADTTSTDPDDGWEYALDIRPQLRVLKTDVFVGVDLSYQARFPRGLNPNTQTAEDPAVFQIAPMIVYSPMGPSAYDRPQIRVVYRAARLNDAARDLFVPDDIRGDHTWTHFLGVQAEWWFNSSTYQ
jgi:hypothetical protein